MIPPTPRLGCCNNSLRSSWCRPAERGRAERGKNDKQHHQVFTAKLRDSWNVSERNHWMKKWGRCRENLQLWPPFLTLVPFLCMINLFVVQRSRLQYGFHMSAKNATSFSKISQLSIHCYHLAFLFHGQMFIYTSYCTWNHFFLHTFTFTFIFTSLRRLLAFDPLSFFVSWKRLSLQQAPSPQNWGLIKIQEIGHLHKSNCDFRICGSFSSFFFR